MTCYVRREKGHTLDPSATDLHSLAQFVHATLARAPRRLRRRRALLVLLDALSCLLQLLRRRVELAAHGRRLGLRRPHRRCLRAETKHAPIKVSCGRWIDDIDALLWMWSAEGQAS